MICILSILAREALIQNYITLYNTVTGRDFDNMSGLLGLSGQDKL